MDIENRTNVDLLVIGDSHTIAISKAVDRDRCEDIISIDVRNKGGLDTNLKKMDPSLFNFYEPKKIVLSFGGTEHNIIGLIECNPKFDFFDEPDGQVNLGRSLVPYAIVESILSYRIASSISRARTARKYFSCDCYFLAPPPPFLEIDDQATLPAAFQPLLEAGIAPCEIRQKLYKVQLAVMERLYAKEGIPMITAPAASMDSAGYLLRDLWNRDPTHGNRAYGQLVVAHLRETLNG